MQIYPSVLEADKEVFTSLLTQYLPIFSHIQIDIADGKFVDNKTVTIEDLIMNASSFMPHISSNTFEFHLMVEDWQSELIKLSGLKNKLNITRVFVHRGAIEQSAVSHPDFEVGLALSPQDTITGSVELILRFPHLLIMTVVPGQQGGEFLPDMLEKAVILRQGLAYKGTITLDGGINEQTLAQILAQPVWPDAVCPGSYFRHEPQQKLRKLQAMVASALESKS